jgi:hypothetical protein
MIGVLFLSVGEVAPVTRKVLRPIMADPERHPIVSVA